MIGYALASAHPSDVRRLVIGEVTIPDPNATPPIPDEVANIKTWHVAFNRLPSLPEALMQGRECVFLNWLFDHKAARPAEIDAAARDEYVRAFSAPGTMGAFLSYYRDAFGPAGLKRMGERRANPLSMPVLTVGGKEGLGEMLGKSFQGLATNVQAVVLDAAGIICRKNVRRSSPARSRNFAARPKRWRADMPAILFALLAGAMLPAQAAVNARLGRTLGSPVWAAAVSGAVLTIALVAIGIVAVRSMPRTVGLLTVPWWAWTGGLCGALVLAATAAVAPRLGTGTMIAMVVVGQVLCSIALDQFGALGVAEHPIDLRRSVAAALIVAGALLTK